MGSLPEGHRARGPGLGLRHGASIPSRAEAGEHDAMTATLALRTCSSTARSPPARSTAARPRPGSSRRSSRCRGLRVDRRADSGDTVALMFRARVGDRSVQGIDSSGSTARACEFKCCYVLRRIMAVAERRRPRSRGRRRPTRPTRLGRPACILHTIVSGPSRGWRRHQPLAGMDRTRREVIGWPPRVAAWRSAARSGTSSSARPRTLSSAPAPVRPAAPADDLGLRLPEGFTSRVVARGRAGAGQRLRWHECVGRRRPPSPSTTAA